MKRFLSITLLIAMLLTVFVSCKGNENQGDPATAGADEIAMKSDNFSFNLAEATYAFNRTYIDFYNENYQYMNYYGIDKESQPERYEVVLENNLMAMLYHVMDVDSLEELKNTDLQAAVTEYLMDNGMTEEEILTLKEKLS